jgi:5-methylcytosine-specific restriction endonuclease McrA
LDRQQLRASRTWRRITDRMRVPGVVCALCGRPIDLDAPPRTRWAFSVDHIVPLSAGGPALDPANLRAAHHGCNSRRGAGRTSPGGGLIGPTSRRW